MKINEKEDKNSLDAVRMIAKHRDLPEDVDTIISFRIPYAIPLPDDVYKFKWREEITDILLHRIQRKEIGGMIVSEGQYVQLPFDKYGKSSYNAIRIKIPRKINTLEEGRKSLLFGRDETKFKDKEIALEILNQFIEKVRYVTGAFWMEPIRYQDFSQYTMSYWDGKKEYFTTKIMLGSGVGPVKITTENPFVFEKDKLEKLKKMLENDIEFDLSKIFLLNSKDACLKEDYRLAIIESVIALEITLYDFIRKRGEILEISRNKLEEFIVDVGLTGNFTVVLKMLTEGITRARNRREDYCYRNHDNLF